MMASSFRRQAIVFLGSLKLAIALLLLIAATSIIGTLIPQDQGPSVLETASFHPRLIQFLLAIKAYDVYHAAWFVALLTALFVNLAVCTWLRFPPTWRRYGLQWVARPKPTAKQDLLPLLGAPNAVRLDILRKRGFRVSEYAPQQYFVEKNKFVRLGPTLIHISLFAIMAGAIWGGLSGVNTSIPIQVGEAVRAEDIVRTARIRGPLSQPFAPFELKLDAFRIDFRPTGQVKQYYSRVMLTAPDAETQTRQVWVNEPLIYRGVYFYQAFWGVAALSLTRNGQTERLSMTPAKTGAYMSAPFKVGGKEFLIFLRSLEEPALLVSTKDFEAVGQLVPGIETALGSERFGIDSYHLYSGFQVKHDPGIPLVYFGCGLLVMGLLMVPFRHRELWITQDGDHWVLMGRSHKGRVILKREMAQLAQVWNDHCVRGDGGGLDGRELAGT